MHIAAACHVHVIHAIMMYCTCTYTCTCTLTQVTALKEDAGRLGMPWSCHGKWLLHTDAATSSLNVSSSLGKHSYQESSLQHLQTDAHTHLILLHACI